MHRPPHTEPFDMRLALALRLNHSIWLDTIHAILDLLVSQLYLGRDMR